MKKVGLLALVLVAACAPPRPPQPSPPPPMRSVAVVIPDGVTTGQAYVDDIGGGQTCGLVGGYCEVVVHDASAGQTFITVTAPGYDPYRQDAVTLPGGNVQVWLGPGCGMPTPQQCVNLPPPTPTFTPLPRLITNGSFFSQDTGQRWTWIGTSSFDLYRQYLVDPVRVEALLSHLQAIGFNVLRVFGSFNGALGHFVPTEYGDAYFGSLSPFVDAAAKKGFYVEFTVFADTTTWAPNVQTQIAHWNHVAATLAGKTNVFLEAVNESDQPINRTDGLPQFGMPATINSSHGSNGAQGDGNGAWGVTPFWHYTTLHQNLAAEWQRKVGHNCFEIGTLVPAPNGWHGPCVGDENKRPDQDGSLTHFYDAAAGAALLSAGATFHSQSGKASIPFNGQDYQAAQQWVAGAKSIPLDCQPGTYKHRQDLESSTYLRVYQRGDTDTCIVRIRY